MYYYLNVMVAYLVAVNGLALFLTIKDKAASKSHSFRIPENALMFIAVAGGCYFMYISMLLIRHKTRHPKFMLGLPLIILLESLALFAAYKLLW